jgi:hypothetical protein
VTFPPFPTFRQHPLVRGGHAQTLAGAFWPAKAFHGQTVRRWVRLDDGDVVVLHDDEPSGWRPGDAAVLLVHGLAGCHRSPYMVRVAEKLNRAGIRADSTSVSDEAFAEFKCAMPTAKIHRSQRRALEALRKFGSTGIHRSSSDWQSRPVVGDEYY